MEKENRNKSGKRFLSTIAAGVIGSVLTLGVVMNTNLIPSTAQDSPAKSEKAASYTVEQTSSKNEVSLSDMVEQSTGAIVGIVNMKETGNRFTSESQNVESGTGSGVVYKIDDHYAYIVTNNHVIEGADKIEVSFQDGETTSAKIVGQDALSDLAVLKIDAKYAKTSLEFGDSDVLRAGDQVIAIGNPLGLEFSGTVTKGIVSAVDRSITAKTSAGEWEFNVIQTDAAINPGNSGGALLNTAGEVIGINSLKISVQGVEGLGFAIPSNEVVPLLEEMTKHGQVERPYIGISMVELEEVPEMYLQELPTSVKDGIMIATVDPESAAGQAGLQAEDVITAINGTAISSSTELRKFLYSELAIGDKVSFTVYRGSKQLTIEATLTSTKANTK